MKLTKVACPQCGGSVEIDEHLKTAKCPYCNSTFRVEETIEHKENGVQKNVVLSTTVIDVEPNAVKNEIALYSLFGWDFKHKSTHKVYDGQRYFKNGNSRDKYKDVVQITFQRNVKASWCTQELLSKEKEFFKIRTEYLEEDKKHNSVDSELIKMYRNAMNGRKYQIGMIVSFVFFYLLALIFFLIYLAGDRPAFGWLSLFVFLAGTGLEVFLVILWAKDRHKQKEAYAKLLKQKEEEYNEKQQLRLNKMDEIIKWAGEHMVAKFGYKISATFEEVSSNSK